MKKNYLAIALIALLFLGSSCRPRQGAHRQPMNVQQPPTPHEHQEILRALGLMLQSEGAQQPQPTVAARATVAPPARTPARDAASPFLVEVSVRQAAPEVSAQQTPTAVSVRQERVDAFLPANVPAFLPTDAPALRRYSVVVASLISRWSAETLQTRLQNDGHHVILAQNEHGMFRVIVGSFDDRASAAAQREALRRQYATMGSPDFLRRTYGVPFNDLWILARGF